VATDKKLDVYGRSDLWEEPIRLRPYRRPLQPLPPACARSPHTLRVLAWLYSYHQAHAWQLQEACGISTFSLSRVVRPLYLAGMVARGRYNPFGAGAVPYTYRLHDGAPLREYLRQLPSEHWLGVTGGAKPFFSNTHLRHNLMVGELALAVAQHVPEVAMALGESFAGASKMFPECRSGAQGDAVLVTWRGLRVVVELTSALSDGLPRKIRRWGRLLSQGDLREHGTVVVFMNGAAHKKHRQVGTVMRRHLLECLSPQGLAQGGQWPSDREVRRARAYVVYADWEEWFQGVEPGLGLAGLLVRFSPDGHSWENTSLLDWDFDPPDPDTWMIPIRNRQRLYAVPHAQLLREGPPVGYPALRGQQGGHG